MKILIVDDRVNLARVTALALRGLGCETCVATTTADALKLLDHDEIDAVFLDVNLNGENGFDFLSSLGAQPGRPPVVMFTAQTREEVAAEAERRGAFDCMVKPFGIDDLRTQVLRLQNHLKFTGSAGHA